MIKKLRPVFAFVLALGLAAPASAEHPMSTIEGTNIHLSTSGHGFAGRIDEALVLGDFQHDIFMSNVSILLKDQTARALFMKSGDTISGSIFGIYGDQIVTTDVRMVRLGERQIQLRINDELYVIQIEAEGFEDNHFINPTYILTHEDGTEVKFKLNGEACYGYSSHLTMMIFGSYMFSQAVSSL